MTLTRRTLLASVPAAVAVSALPTTAFAAPKLRFPQIGSSVNGPLFTTLGYAQVDTTRVYLRQLPAGSSWTNVDGESDLRDGTRFLAPGGTLWLSYKEENVQRASDFFDTIPQQVQNDYRILATWFHEPEDNVTSAAGQADYRAVWRDHSAMIRSHKMLPTTCFMRYTLQAGSGRDWRDWWPGDQYVDFTGWDVYRKGAAGQNGPQTIANMAAPIEQIAADTGTRWAIGETGSTRDRYSNADTAIWAANWRAHILNAPRASVACWWDQDAFTFTPLTAAAWLG